MYRRIIFFLIFCVLFSGILFLWGKASQNPFCFLDIGTHHIPPQSIEINASHSYGQSFVANFNHLFKISIFIFNQSFQKDHALYFRLLEEGHEIFSREIRFQDIRPAAHDFHAIPPAAEINKQGFHFHIPFPVIQNSKNRNYSFYLESSEVKGLKIGFWPNKNYYEALTKGNAFLNSTPLHGFLAFRTFHTWEGSPSNIFFTVKTRLLNDKVFFIFWCMSMILLFLNLIYFKIRNASK